MAHIDRTREFLALVEVTAAGRGGGSHAFPAPLHVPQHSGHAVPDSRSAFMSAVSSVSTDLHGASLKLAALTKLVRRRGMFGDAGAEIERMTASVKDDMRTVGTRLDGLQEYIARRRVEAVKGGAQPGRPLAAKSGPDAAAHAGTGSAADADVLSSIQGLNHSDAVVGQLKGQLLGQTVSLKTLLQTRAESVHAQAGRRAQFGGARDLGRPLDFTATIAAAAGGAGGHGAANANSAASAHERPSETAISIGGMGGGGGGAFAQMEQSQLLPEAALVESRAADVAAIERHIGEISAMFTRLANVVAEQGGMVERIEDDLEAAHASVDAGQAQLTRYWQRVSSNRALALRLGAVTVGAVVLFVLFGV